MWSSNLESIPLVHCSLPSSLVHHPPNSCECYHQNQKVSHVFQSKKTHLFPGVGCRVDDSDDRGRSSHPDMGRCQCAVACADSTLTGAQEYGTAVPTQTLVELDNLSVCISTKRNLDLMLVTLCVISELICRCLSLISSSTAFASSPSQVSTAVSPLSRQLLMSCSRSETLSGGTRGAVTSNTALAVTSNYIHTHQNETS